MESAEHVSSHSAMMVSRDILWLSCAVSATFSPLSQGDTSKEEATSKFRGGGEDHYPVDSVKLHAVSSVYTGKNTFPF